VINFNKLTEARLGYRIRAIFAIQLHLKDIDILKKIQAYFGGIGAINVMDGDIVAYRVRTLNDLKKVIAHFDNFPLQTKKQADFELFKRAVFKLLGKEHLNPKGLQDIVNLRASINLGLTDKLRVAFPNTLPVPRPVVEDREIPHYE
jgi:hypothetical protein